TLRTPLLATALLAPSLLVAQAAPADLARERAARTQWLLADAESPARAAALALVGPAGVSLGPTDTDVPVAGAPHGVVKEVAGQLVLSGWGPDRTLVSGRATALYGVRLRAFGTPGRSSLLVYQESKPGKRPLFYPWLAAARRTVTLTATTPKPQRILSPDGTTVSATEIGTVAMPFGDSTATLRVMRIPFSEDESQLLINFRDATTGDGTYPAGRFVELIPAGGDRYVLDLNRAFNPNCAYSSVFPCPIPWSGNVIAGRVEAGERYPAEGAH
ncbi:MAG TPA: DUF1684 domain-containing protein, partial [Gemmatimonadales bacterium]|nr:DUF1684 domain-containing protein [Gemmatimonadales bacterium]